MSDELGSRVGRNVRSLRESSSMSLAQVAARAGIAKSTLSQIEAGTTNPTLGTLAALAATFSVDVARLLDLSESGPVVVRRGEGADVSGESSVGELMQSMAVGSSIIEIHRIRLEAGTHESSPRHGAGSREHVLVDTGRLRAGPDGFDVEVGAGDYLSYDGDQLHRFEALGDGPACYWIVASYPRRFGD